MKSWYLNINLFSRTCVFIFWEITTGLSFLSRVVLVRYNQGFGGGGRDNSGTARLLGNIDVAVRLTYLSVSGQPGWILDTLISIWACLSFSVFCLFFCWMIVSLDLNKFIVWFIGIYGGACSEWCGFTCKLMSFYLLKIRSFSLNIYYLLIVYWTLQYRGI